MNKSNIKNKLKKSATLALTFMLILQTLPASAADITAPSIPTTLTATAVSSSQINLSWTASTDDVGVTGYKIYRCSGSGCTPTAQISTPATNSYSDTGLTASTAYTYTVSAYDAAGNESGKSVPAQATTPVSTGYTYYISPVGNDTTGNGSNTSPWATLSKAFSQMQGGDTLVIRDGSYKGISNAMNDAGSTVYPPNGIPGNYTIIRAENEGQVVFDGEGVKSMFYLVNPHQYIQFQGINWINSGIDSAVTISHGDHIKILRSGAGKNITNNSASSFYILNSSYVLLEDVYAWGAGRYKFIFFVSDHIVCRRCVGRTDATTGLSGDTPSVIAQFMNYCSQYIEYQNSTAIDSNIPQYWTQYSELHGGFTTHPRCDFFNEGTDNGWWRGSIALNVLDNFIVTSTDAPNLNFMNFVGWNANRGTIGETRPYKLSIDHSLFGNLQNEGIYDWSGNTAITNSIIFNASTGIRGAASSDYNSLYTNMMDYLGISPGPNDLSAANGSAINPKTGTPGNGVPALKYLLRVEDGSNLDGAASDGGDIGPTILKKIGVSGTLYGEPGYNEVTNEDLWPFPYEDQIKSAFASYNPGGADPTKPDGKRGFAADGTGLYGGPITLTSYIWEYLGNPCPAEICGSKGSPTIIITQPTTRSTYSTKDSTVNLSGTATDDISVSKVTWSNSTGGSGTAQGTTTWSIPDIPLQLGSNTITVTAEDPDGNTGTDSITVTYDPEPPSLPTNLTATVISSSQINLPWIASTDNVGVVGYRVYRDDTQIASATSTSYSDTGLQPSTTYTYTVSAYDAAGNESARSNSASTKTNAVPITGDNIALNKPVTSSGNEFTLGSYTRVNDGIVNGVNQFWAARGVPNWVIIDLQSAYPVERIKINPFGNGGSIYYYDSAWNVKYATESNPNTFLDFAEVTKVMGTATLTGGGISITNGDPGTNTADNGYQYYEFTFTPTSAKYIKFEVTRGDKDGDANLDELEVYQFSTSPPPDTTPPTIPTNFTATAISPSEINLSCTDSTDNMGVTGYKIYRCAGSACTPTTQIATSATNSYSNTGLTASTTYAYAISAYDAAGNESGKSSSVSATTKAPADTSPPVQPRGFRIK